MRHRPVNLSGIKPITTCILLEKQLARTRQRAACAVPALMKLHITSAYDVHPGLDNLLSSAQLDNERTHILCDSADHADAIVFVENTQFDDVLFSRLREHEWVHEYPEKVFMYNEMDRPWDVLPGLYTCMTRKHLDAGKQRAFAYLSTPNRYVRNVYHENPERCWLYSFMGAMSHTCRRHIMRLSADQAFLKDTSDFNVWNSSEEELDLRAKDYSQVLGSSQFVLCPRGIGTSSIRLYETLEAGRTPVIISDQWVPPAETDWSFALQVPEKRVSSIPGLLKSIVSEATDRGEAAREAWLSSYAPHTLFNTLGDAIEDIQRQGHNNSGPDTNNRLEWNKWLASGGLYTRTAVQRLRGQR